jgi:hypothetical protein
VASKHFGNYQEKKRKYDEACERARRVAATLEKTLAVVPDENTLAVVLDGLHGKVEVEIDPQRPRNTNPPSGVAYLYSSDWPSIAQVEDVLRQMVEAKHELIRAFNRLPEEEKRDLPPPPTSPTI